MPNEKRELLEQIFSRMCFHFGLDLKRQNHKRRIFIHSLCSYPDDLLCAAYQHLLKHASPQHFPTADDFISFIEPEYQRRKQMMHDGEVCYG